MNRSRNSRRNRTTSVPVPAPVNPLQETLNALDRYKELTKEIEENVSRLYKERDEIAERKLIPMIVEDHADYYIVHKRVTVGSRTITVTPSFVDAAKNRLRIKAWKSAAHPTFTIEG